MRLYKREMVFEHWNVRGEKAGDEQGPTAADLKLVGEMKHTDVKPLFPSEADWELLLNNLYQQDGDAKGNLKTRAIEELALTTEGTNMLTTMKTFSGEHIVEFKGGDLNGIVIRPLDGFKVHLKVRLQVNPTPKQFSTLAEMYKQSVTIESKGRQAELDLGGEGDDDEEKGGGKKEKQLELKGKEDANDDEGDEVARKRKQKEKAH